MTKDTSPSPVPWWIIWAEDPEALSGESIYEFVTRILRCCQGPIVAMHSLDWIVPNFGSYKIHNRTLIVSTTDFLEVVRKLPQIDWAQLYFCESSAAAEKIVFDEPILNCVEKSVFSVVLEDYSYFSLYTREKALIDEVKNQFNRVEVEEIRDFKLYAQKMDFSYRTETPKQKWKLLRLLLSRE